jgi:hypothetical protein
LNYEITACYFPGTGEAELTYRAESGEYCALTVPVTPEQGEKLASVVWPCVAHTGKVLPPRLTQDRLHTEAQNGDCFATCVDILLARKGCPKWEVDEDWGDYYLRYTKYLADQGLALVRLSGHPVLQEYYIASGPASRGLYHACVYYAGELFYDPHPSREGLLNVEWVELLVNIEIPLSLTKGS